MPRIAKKDDHRHGHASGDQPFCGCINAGEEKESDACKKDRKIAELQAIIAENESKMAELSQQLQATKELGDEAGWFNRRAGKDHRQDTGE